MNGAQYFRVCELDLKIYICCFTFSIKERKRRGKKLLSYSNMLFCYFNRVSIVYDIHIIL